jgi:hypothetical protein
MTLWTTWCFDGVAYDHTSTKDAGGGSHWVDKTIVKKACGMTVQAFSLG